VPSENGLPPARQWAKKLRVINDLAVLGVSGHDGLAQEMALSLERCLADGRHDSHEEVLRSEIRDALATPVQRTVAIHRTLQGLPGYGITTTDYVLSQSLVAVPFGKSLRLYVLDPDCSLTEITEELSWVAIGNARAIAEPFLAFLRHILWGGGLPSTAHGELAAYWSVRHAMEYYPAGLARPIQLTVMSLGRKDSVEVVERGERELAILDQTVEASVDAIRRSFGAQHTKPAGSGSAPPTPPPPSAEKPPRKRVPEVRLTIESPEQRKKGRKW
jgi:hypothetical protein